ncbi:MAG: hypothetical protein WDO73_05720 [Ignavibacteriota bacterium]
MPETGLRQTFASFTGAASTGGARGRRRAHWRRGDIKSAHIARRARCFGLGDVDVYFVLFAIDSYV